MRLLLAFAVVLTSSYCAAEKPRDKVIQEVLSEYGVESEIIKTYSSLERLSSRPDKKFSITLVATPKCTLLLEHDYWILAIKPKRGDDLLASYMLNPQDEQSALNFSVFKGKSDRGGFDKSKEPGFSGYKMKSGLIAGHPIQWKRCGTTNHLYSQAKLTLNPTNTTIASQITLVIEVTANSENRLVSLENSIESMTVEEIANYEQPNKPVEPVH